VAATVDAQWGLLGTVGPVLRAVTVAVEARDVNGSSFGAVIRRGGTGSLTGDANDNLVTRATPRGVASAAAGDYAYDTLDRLVSGTRRTTSGATRGTWTTTCSAS
jgi:hypothetical protein